MWPAMLFCVAPNHLDTDMRVCSYIFRKKSSSPLCGHTDRIGSLDPYLELKKGAHEVESWLSMLAALSIVVYESC